MKKLSSGIELPVNIKQLKKESLDMLCADLKIRQFMQNNDLNREMMNDYWIELLNYQEDYKMCENCKGIDDCKKNMKGYQRLLKYENNRVLLDMQPCSFEVVHARHIQVLNQIQPCNMPKSIFDIRFKDLIVSDRLEALTLLAQYIKNPTQQGVYLHGTMQNGKTTVMAAFIYELALKGKNCAVMNVPSLIAGMKEQFSTTNSNSELMMMLKHVDVLFLDDIGGENATPWSRDEVLSSIVNERALRKLPTFFTSVYTLEELKKNYVLSKQIGDKIKVERLIEKMKAVSVPVELKSSKFSM